MRRRVYPSERRLIAKFESSEFYLCSREPSMRHGYDCGLANRSIQPVQGFATSPSQYHVRCVACEATNFVKASSLAEMPPERAAKLWWLTETPVPAQAATTARINAVIDIYNRTYGSHTRAFGVKYFIRTTHGDYSLSVGGGNNASPRARVRTELPADFSQLQEAGKRQVLEAALNSISKGLTEFDV
jgi:hypothetical protein